MEMNRNLSWLDKIIILATFCADILIHKQKDLKSLVKKPAVIRLSFVNLDLLPISHLH